MFRSSWEKFTPSVWIARSFKKSLKKDFSFWQTGQPMFHRHYLCTLISLSWMPHRTSLSLKETLSPQIWSVANTKASVRDERRKSCAARGTQCELQASEQIYFSWIFQEEVQNLFIFDLFLFTCFEQNSNRELLYFKGIPLSNTMASVNN